MLTVLPRNSCQNATEQLLKNRASYSCLEIHASFQAWTALFPPLNFMPPALKFMLSICCSLDFRGVVRLKFVLPLPPRKSSCCLHSLLGVRATFSWLQILLLLEVFSLALFSSCSLSSMKWNMSFPFLLFVSLEKIESLNLGSNRCNFIIKSQDVWLRSILPNDPPHTLAPTLKSLLVPFQVVYIF